MTWHLAWQIVVFAAGVFLVLSAVLAAVRSFVLPRNESVLVNDLLFKFMRYLFDAVAWLGNTYAVRDRVMALYAPITLVALPVVWLAMVSWGFTCMFWALGEGSLEECYVLSNASLLTLGSEKSYHLRISAFVFAEATFGMLLVTLLISYLPTIYQAFSRRERVIVHLELRAGTPATPTSLIKWLYKTGSLAEEQEHWYQWEKWFVDIEESHTSLPVLSFFRSPQAGRSWVNSASIVLEAAALVSSCVDQPRNPYQELCFKAGCLTLNRVSRFFSQRTHAAPTPLTPKPLLDADPTYQEFQRACDTLAEAGLPMVADRDQAWHQYQELHGLYADALQYLGELLMTPEKASGKNKELVNQ